MDITDALTGNKTDQLNAEDLLAGSRIITVQRVTRGNGEQPVVVHFEGDNGRPWKPALTCRRILARAWGTDASAWVGRRLDLYRDDSVTWSGKRVGGIRISRMSHITGRLTMSLPLNKKAYKEHIIEPLPEPTAPTLPEVLSAAGVSPEQAEAWAAAKGKQPIAELAPEQAATLAAFLGGPKGGSVLAEMRATEVADG